jgi:hypothetical protein
MVKQLAGHRTDVLKIDREGAEFLGIVTWPLQ